MSEKLTKHKKLKGARKHGFRSKIKTSGGIKTLKRRRQKGRKRLSS
jgi:large subunit ribosomal protein L34